MTENFQLEAARNTEQSEGRLQAGFSCSATAFTQHGPVPNMVATVRVLTLNRIKLQILKCMVDARGRKNLSHVWHDIAQLHSLFPLQPTYFCGRHMYETTHKETFLLNEDSREILEGEFG